MVLSLNNTRLESVVEKDNIILGVTSRSLRPKKEYYSMIIYLN